MHQGAEDASSALQLPDSNGKMSDSHSKPSLAVAEHQKAENVLATAAASRAAFSDSSKVSDSVNESYGRSSASLSRVDPRLPKE